MLTVALPTYNNAPILWLQLESLCAQVDAPEWELIMCEEMSENYFGADELFKYEDRLKKAGCVSVRYLSLSNWIPLAQKWLVIRDHMHQDSKGFLLCASDNYSPCDRLAKTWDALQNGADWVQWQSGYFYNILAHEAGLFNGRDELPALFMALSRKMIDRVVPFDYPKKGVDTWLFRHSKPENVVNYPMCMNGVHTDGYNTISHGRRSLYSGASSGMFTEVDANEVIKIFPAVIYERLKIMRK